MSPDIQYVELLLSELAHVMCLILLARWDQSPRIVVGSCLLQQRARCLIKQFWFKIYLRFPHESHASSSDWK